MGVHLLRLATEPAEWASSVAIGQVHIAPAWPESARFAMIAVVRYPGPRDEAHTRAFWVSTPEEMDHLLTKHECHILWFTVAKHRITEDMIEQTLSSKEQLP